MTVPRLLITTGEPAGIGPDLAAMLCRNASRHERVLVGDPELLRSRARALGLSLTLSPFDPARPPAPSAAGRAEVLPVALATPATAGRLDPANARYVLELLARATRACLRGEADALVTAPVHKGVINDAGIPFTGHTEYLAHLCATEQVVMMLAIPGLRVALATTHLPLRQVPDAITAPRLRRVMEVLHHDLRRRFGIADPHILVCGLNPHAGEGGHLGDEEMKVIRPVVESLSAGGMRLSGPVPADTAFLPARLEGVDAVLAMYHDQGLPVLKGRGFGQAVNVTLGLPVIRVSVDHGTALELAGSGHADPGSLQAAEALAAELATRSGS